MRSSKVVKNKVIVQLPYNYLPKLDFTSSLAAGNWVIVEILQKDSPVVNLFGNFTITQLPDARPLVKANFEG